MLRYVSVRLGLNGRGEQCVPWEVVVLFPGYWNWQNVVSVY